MKTTKRLFGALLCFLCVSAPALAGPRVGNGGGAWICQERGGGFRWAQLVDLFEAENEYGLHLAASSERDPWIALGDKVAYLQAHAPSLAALLAFGPAELREAVQMVPARGSLTRIDDDAIRVRPNPQSCEGGVLYYGQLANFTPDGRLLIADDIWSNPAFGARAQAALLLHELIYKALRDSYGDQTSSRSRALVALAFSDLPAEALEARVKAILGPTAEKRGPAVLRAPYRVICEAHIEEMKAPFGPISSSRWELALGGEEELELGAFLFRAVAERDRAAPMQLAITERATGGRVILRREVVAAAFAQEARVSVSFESAGAGGVGTLACFAIAR